MTKIRSGRVLRSLVAVLVLGSSIPASAERIASKAEDASASRAVDLARVSQAMARQDVARALAVHGLSAAQVDDRLQRLSDADLQRLAANLEQVQAAGQVPNYIWVLLGIFLAVSIIVMII
jgi:hypothetical protein